MRHRDPDSDFWYLAPSNPQAEIRFRRENIVIIAFLALLVIGLFTAAVLPNKAIDNASSTHAVLKTTKPATP
jgi:hypothetical protein